VTVRRVPRMPRKPTKFKQVDNRIVDFDFEDRTYQIDPRQKKVYRRFVEIETSRAAHILSNWRARHAV
jgi:hypothetical protein